MTSPDISQYVDLSLFDKQPADIYSDAVIYAQTSLPEFSPVPGSVEDAILQANVSFTGELVAAINRMTPGLLEVVLQLFGITRNSGTTPTGTVTITTIDNAGYTIPAGTRFAYYDNTDISNPQIFAFDTAADLVIPTLSTTGNVAITATFSVQYPALSAGQSLQLITPTSFISSASLTSNLLIGADPESDSEYFSRAVATINSYSSALSLPTQMTQYILSHYSEVYRATTYSRVNAATDTIASSLVNGYVTCYVSGLNGVSLSATAMSAIAVDLTAHSTAGLIIAVKAPSVVTIPVATTVTHVAGYTTADIQANVQDALDEYLHPDFWGWGNVIYYNELISLIDQCPGVGRVVSLTINGATTDYSFVKYGMLPRNSASITVT